MNKIIVANWKMHHTPASAVDFVVKSRDALRLATPQVDVIICPAYPLIPYVKNETLGTSIKVGAQNISWEDEGAFTGEVAPAQLQGLAEYVIIGHSERRKYFAEDAEMIRKKLELAFANNLKPIFCFENTDQLQSVARKEGLILAYEPTFAIGTGQPDTPENASAVSQEARRILQADLPVLYGGSVTAENVASFVSRREISGALVGGASLEAANFVNLVHASIG